MEDYGLNMVVKRIGYTVENGTYSDEFTLGLIRTYFIQADFETMNKDITDGMDTSSE